MERLFYMLSGSGYGVQMGKVLCDCMKSTIKAMICGRYRLVKLIGADTSIDTALKDSDGWTNLSVDHHTLL